MNSKITELDTYPTFLTFCKIWEADGRAPYGLYLWLKDEIDLEDTASTDGYCGAAESILWCHLEPSRVDVTYGTRGEYRGKKIGIRPYLSMEKYIWCVINSINYGSYLPKCLSDGTEDDQSQVYFDTIPQSIIWLLQRWDEVRPIVIRGPGTVSHDSKRPIIYQNKIWEGASCSV